jgi:hypothetical protein
MAIWQFRLRLIPENILLTKFEVLPLVIPEVLAEDFPWWSDAQPHAGFERQLDNILPERASWSTSIRMWGQEDGNDANVYYRDDNKNEVEEISFRLDASSIQLELVRDLCQLARRLGCVLITADYELLAPDESMVLLAIHNSTAKKFIDDPVSTLRSLGRPEVQQRFRNRIRDDQDNSPKRKE